MSNRRGKWNYISEDQLVRQINEVEIRERKEREEDESRVRFTRSAENEHEVQIQERLDNTANPIIDNSAIRTQTVIKQQKKIAKLQGEYENTWLKEMRKTITGIREYEESLKHDVLVREQQRLQKQIAQLQ